MRSCRDVLWGDAFSSGQSGHGPSRYALGLALQWHRPEPLGFKKRGHRHQGFRQGRRWLYPSRIAWRSRMALALFEKILYRLRLETKVRRALWQSRQ